MRAEPLIDRAQAARSLAALSLPDLLLRQGSMTGPYRRTVPVTLSPITRAVRWMRRLLIDAKGPIL